MSSVAQSTPAASRYGQALFEAAKSQSALEAVQGDMSLLKDVL